MAQLDTLIDALFKHSAEALVLDAGQQAALLIGGCRRPIVKSTLSAERVLSLVGEIAPAAERQAVASGRGSSFGYESGGLAVVVEVGPGPSVVIRGGEKPAPVQAPRVSPQQGERLTMAGLFRMLVERGASDLHLSSDARPRLRVDGELAEIADAPLLSPEEVDRLLLEIAPERNRKEFTERGDTDFAHELPEGGRIRCNMFRDRRGPGGVFRIIPSKILTVDELGLSKEVRELCLLTKGLVLVTGPTGSGKSTTLASLVDHINATRTDHIITIEDPIEFVHPHRKCLVNQREVPGHTLDFKTALRAALREDPDVVLVGEMRDLETVSIALETAETGHLVFGTLHTSSAVSTVDRLVDQFPSGQQDQIRIMLAESLKAVIAQVLCRKIGGGRVAALEVLIVTPAVSNLIREGKTFQVLSIMQTGRKYGMITMNDALLDLVKRKVVAPREAYLKALDKPNLLSAFQGQRIPVDFLETPQPTKTA